MFGTKERKSVRKKGLLKSLRLSLASRNSEMNTYSSTPCECNGEAKSFKSEAYLLSKKRMYEVEAEKALMINVSRHPRWVAGGPH